MQGEFEKTVGGLINEHVFARPIRLSDVPSWQGHIPFAYFLTGLLKPRILVELGTHKGDSYAAFCQTVQTLDIETRCFAVDTWEGDDHAGQYSNEIYESISQFNSVNFSEFSTLLRARFEEAVDQFADKSVDLLHIDGLHTYDAVKADFETWQPKLSDRAIVLFHDTQVRDGDFGVWKFWAELSSNYPSKEFTHSHGLGVLGYGHSLDENVRTFLDKPAGEWSFVQQFFERLGSACSVVGTQLRLEGDLKRERQERDHLLDVIQVQKVDFEREQTHLKDIIATVQAALEREEQTTQQLRNSTSWRVTRPLRSVAQALGWSRSI